MLEARLVDLAQIGEPLDYESDPAERITRLGCARGPSGSRQLTGSESSA
jgi:hypothetical protein